MLRLRPYNKNDYEFIKSFISNEDVFYKWSQGKFGEYPLNLDKFNEVIKDMMSFTMIDDDKIAGFLTMRRLSDSYDEIRFGFIVVDPEIRGKGYGKEMLKLALKFAKEIYQTKKVSIAVFDNNESAYNCYLKLGFKDASIKVKEEIKIKDEKWLTKTVEYIF